MIQKNHGIHHHEIKSLLLTTSEPVSDAYGQEFSLNEAGSGRLNIARAFDATLVIEPPNFVLNISSDNPIGEQVLKLKSLVASLENIKVTSVAPEFIQISHFLEGDNLKIIMKVQGDIYGDHEGKIFITQNDDRYIIPFLLHFTKGSVSVSQEIGRLNFEISYPEPWTFAKISVTNSKDGTVEIVSASPTESTFVNVYENGEYWVESKIRVGDESFDAFKTIEVNSVLPGTSKPLKFFDLPEKQIGIIIAIMVFVGLIGVRYIKKPRTMLD